MPTFVEPTPAAPHGVTTAVDRKPVSAARPVMPAVVFIVLAAEVLAISLVLGAYVVLWYAWDAAASQRPPAGQPLWGGLIGLLLLLASITLWMAMRLHKRGQRRLAFVLLGIAFMYGVTMTGARLAEVRSTAPPQVVYAGIELPAAPRPAPAPAPLPAPAAAGAELTRGDLSSGRQLYMSSCLSCHGTTGQGSAGAPPFAATGFIATASDDELFAVIKQGRSAGDPANHSGRTMPAQGGNPFLTDDNIEDLMVFLRTLADSDDHPPADAEPVDPSLLLPRWTVPPGEVQAGGVDDSVIEAWGGPTVIWMEVDSDVAAERARFSRLLLGSALGIHSFHVLLGMGFLASLLYSGAIHGGRISRQDRLGWTAWWWHMATAGWLVLFSTFYLIN